MSSSERRAVVIDSDLSFRPLVRAALTRVGLLVCDTLTGEAGLARCASDDPTIVVLSLDLPDADGIEIVRRLRRSTPAYLLAVTSGSGEDERCLALEAGADDCISKPVSERELQARVAALLRRPRDYSTTLPTLLPPDAGPVTTFRYGDLEVDVASRVVSLAGRELELTKTEFDLLATMLSEPHRVWSRNMLLRSVWDTDWAPDGHLIEVHVGNLRRKLGDDARTGRYVRTVRGVGYRLAADQPV